MRSETPNAPETHAVVEEIAMAQPFSIVVSVCDDIAVRELRADAVMPAHQHGMNYAPKVAALGDGVFRVDNMLFHMPGLWELQIDVTFDGRSVSYTSDIVLK